ncbi:restriction endonuclease [Pseudomonas sp. TTU2014-096BSC]|nr:restriction endonuclease [Pseudomonas sp. TTU2014-096BSC]
MLIREAYPSYIKYMGSKSKIMDFVLEGINEVRRPNEPVIDLFAGSASLAGAIGRQTDFVSNDIQAYSKILSRAYACAWRGAHTPTADELLLQAKKIAQSRLDELSAWLVDYSKLDSLEEFNSAEKNQRELLNRHFESDWFLFTKYYSGTWWTAEQCIRIDAIRGVAERYLDDPAYDVILASLMFAMAYCSQGTGHYAQYRDANTVSSMKDILLYRQRDINAYFKRKYEQALEALPTAPPVASCTTSSLDYKQCLAEAPTGTVYADPPYCFVHYSRFYHALETLVLYDYPDLQIKGGAVVKGRYRAERHQSPFSIRSQVPGAFNNLFRGIATAGSRLVLSYSNTGMISLDQLVELANEAFPDRRRELLTMDHQHMTLGRQGIRHRDVTECLLLVY